MFRIILAVLGIFLLVSCTQNQEGAVSTSSGSHNTGALEGDENSLDHDQENSGDVQEPLVETISGDHEEYSPIFNGIESKEIHVVHHTGVPTKISFINSEAKAVEVNITFPEDEKAPNLRFSQIVMPDGSMDGPFGMHVGYNLDQLGGYTLLFSENQMAGDRWSGDAVITLTMKDTPYSESVVLLP